MHYSIKELPKEERPYEKFLKYGPKALSDTEILAVLLKSGTKDKTSIELARDILLCSDGSYSLLSLYKKSFAELKAIKGIGTIKAISLKCIAEISERIVTSTYSKKMRFVHPKDIADYYMESFRHLEYEIFMAVFLDSANYFINDIIFTKGTVNKSLVSSREIFIKALEYKAVNIIVLHNHPSGNPTPSTDDIEVTKALAESGKLLSICLLDHIIIGDKKYISFREQGLLSDNLK